MNTTVEVFADTTCPFTHVGLKRVTEHVADLAPVQVKAAALSEQLGVDDFAGLWPDHWPSTTLPTLELAAAAYGVDAARGMAVNVALFEQSCDVGDLNVLAEIAAEHGGAARDMSDAVQADYEDVLAQGSADLPTFGLATPTSSAPRSTSATMPTTI